LDKCFHKWDAKPYLGIRKSNPDLKVSLTPTYNTVFSESNSYNIFQNGIWATPIPTITRKEAEEQLNKKIVD